MSHLLDTGLGIAAHAGLTALRIVGTLAVVAAILIPLEKLAPLRRGGVVRAALLTDLVYYLMATTLPFRLLEGPTAAIAWATHGFPFSTLTAAAEGLPLWARLGAALVVNEIGVYWAHRLCHEIPFLWRFHAIHHSPETLDFWVGTRLHPLDPAFAALFGLVPVYALGLASPATQAGTLTAVALPFAGTAWHFFVHANTRVRLGFLEHIVTSPFFHHWHHTLEAPLDRNYANLFPWLDRIFGTYHSPADASWPTRYGIREQLAPTLPGQLAQPFAPLIGWLRRPRGRPVAEDRPAA